MIQNGLQGAAAGSLAGLGIQAMSGKGSPKSAADSSLSRLLKNLADGGATQIKDMKKTKPTRDAISNTGKVKPDPRTAVTGRMKSAGDKLAARIINGDVGLNVIIERLKLARSKHGQSKTAGLREVLQGLGLGGAPARVARRGAKPQMDIHQMLAKRLKKPTLTTNPPLVLATR